MKKVVLFWVSENGRKHTDAYSTIEEAYEEMFDKYTKYDWDECAVYMFEDGLIKSSENPTKEAMIDYIKKDFKKTDISAVGFVDEVLWINIR